MIPVSLKLKDFMSYEEGSIDFTSFEVACLTGANGQGKSSLLDAITYALFGCARGCEAGQNAERLIRDGADKMTVEFVFDLADKRYKIVRRRGRTGKNDLRFEIADGTEWRTLAGDTMSATNKAIEDVLHLDYEIFTASAFFLQGRADEFLTRMKPEKRKEVFGRLLDLGVYEKLEDAARTHAREAEAVRKIAAAEVESLRDAEPALAETRTLLGAADLQLKQLSQELADLESSEKNVLEELGKLERTQAAADSLRQNLQASERRLAQDRTRLGERNQEATILDEKLARSAEVAVAVIELEELRRSDEQMRATAHARQILQMEVTKLEAAIQASMTKVANEVKTLEADAARADAEAETLRTLEQQVERDAATVAAGAELVAVLAQVDSELNELRDRLAQLKAEIAALDASDGELSERIQILEKGEGDCPVCGGELDAVHRDELMEGAKAQLSANAVCRVELQAAATEVTSSGKALGKQRDTMKGQCDELSKLAGQLEANRKSLQRLPELVVLAADCRTKASAQSALAAEDIDPESTSRLIDVRKELSVQIYDDTTHSALRQRITELDVYSKLQGELAQASVRRAAVAEEIVQLATAISEAQVQVADQAKALEGIEDVFEAVAAMKVSATEASLATSGARQRFTQSSAEIARLSERLDVLSGQVDKLKVAQASEMEAATMHRRYTRLVSCFGRGGIPDLIIENALPELQQEASEILGKLTNWDMSLRFVMDKTTKSGSVKDTFDVRVHHDGGDREFQMFSGGEAFRISFAIRLGLSKLLVRRAGARMETLVIDEGFGTQDPEGRERLVEVINLAREDFKKVIVITHLEELKQAFGTQIQVTKDARSGSRVAVLES